MTKIIISAILLVLLLAACGNMSQDTTAIAQTNTNTISTGEDAMVSTIKFRRLKYKTVSNNHAEITSIKKFYFEYTAGSSADLLTSVGIDFEKRALFYNVGLSTIDVSDPDHMLSDEEIEKIRNIINKNKIQEWQYSYFLEEESIEDGFSWYMIMENPDETVEVHKGSGNKNDCTPAEFDAFINDLDNFLKEIKK